jgi:ABC-2 type transport system permease protein
VIAALSSEWLKLRTTRTLFWLLVALSALMTLIVVAGVIGSQKHSITSAKDQLDLLGIGSLGIFIALIMGLIVSTGEFRHGTITPTLLATPSRTSIVIAKALAGMFFAVALVGLAEGLVALELAIALPAKGVDFAIQGGPAAGFIGRILIAAALWGALGSGIGIVIRNQIGAVVASFAWLFIAEGLIIAILHSNAINSNDRRGRAAQPPRRELARAPDPSFGVDGNEWRPPGHQYRGADEASDQRDRGHEAADLQLDAGLSGYPLNKEGERDRPDGEGADHLLQVPLLPVDHLHAELRLQLLGEFLVYLAATEPALGQQPRRCEQAADGRHDGDLHSDQKYLAASVCRYDEVRQEARAGVAGSAQAPIPVELEQPDDDHGDRR